MTAALPILSTAALMGAALSPLTYLILLALLTIMIGNGLLVCRAAGINDSPFLAVVVGFVVLSYALLAVNFVLPGAHWQVAVALAVPALLSLRGGMWRSGWPTAWLCLAVAGFTVTWCADIAPRLHQFYATGVFRFWLDALVHAGTVAQMASPNAIGRGMVLMADNPAQLYHLASYTMPALLSRLTGMAPLAATVLVWIPFGILVMTAGVVALGDALGGPLVAAMTLAALALIPDPSRFFLGNGWFSFSWLLEISPGTGYSLGVSCAALAALIHWTRHQNPRTLALALALTASCVLVRINTFVWLAPVVGLATIAGWQRLPRRWRCMGLAIGIIGLVGALLAMSWPALRSDAADFLFGYVEFALKYQGPTAHDTLYPALLQALGRDGAGLAGVGLILLCTLGPWLPGFAILALAVLSFRRKAVSNAWPALALPLLLLVVAAIMILLAPMARNGDISEYRHRAGPLLVVIVAVCSVQLAAIIIAPIADRLFRRSKAICVIAITVVALVMQSATISAAKRPRMAWGRDNYGTSVSPALMTLAPLLSSGPRNRRRFAVANQPANSRNIDDAARLVALSGVPAYLSCPGFMISTGGEVAVEARRRLAVLARLAAATTLAQLRAEMTAAGITDYVVTRAQDVPYDPDRRGAVGHQGTYAIYQMSAQ